MLVLVNNNALINFVVLVDMNASVNMSVLPNLIVK